MKEEYSEEDQSSCCSRNGLSICLFLSLLISLTALGAVSYFLILDQFQAGTCSTMKCVKSASEIADFVNDQKDPCSEFHEFVCGRFAESAYERQTSNPLKAEHDRLENKLNTFIVEPESKEDSPPVQMQKRYFRSCLNEEEIDNGNNSVFYQLVNEVGVWPLSEEEHWKRNAFDWTEVMIKSRRLGLPFDWFLDIDIHDNGHYLLKISKPKSCDVFENYPTRKLMGDIMAAFKNQQPADLLFERYSQISNFEYELATVCSKVKNDTVVMADLAEFSTLWNQPISAVQFLTGITGQSRRWQHHSKIVYHRNYIRRLQDLLQRTPKQTQAYYIGWKMIQYFAPYLTKSVREKYKHYLESHSEGNINRFEFCLEDTKSKFNLVSETMYIRKHTNPSVKEAAEAVVDSLKAQLVENIIEKLSNESAHSYLKFYEELETIVGGPEEIFDEEIFENYLFVGQIRFRHFNIIQMITEWSRSTFNSKMSMIGRNSEASALDFAFMANRGFGVFLSTDKKAIILPATILQGVIYDIDRPMYLNYGSLGSLIGKKLIESFHILSDDNDIYDDNEECLTKNILSSSYSNVSLIVQSNYADLIGRDLAYRAYQKYVEENGEEPTLPGVDYGQNQLFWIKSSINWCYQDLPNEDSNSFVQDMFKYRIIETAKNSPYFGEDFECVLGSKMHPKNKCTIFKN